MSAAQDSGGFRLNGWHVLAGMAGFFGLVIAVDVGMAVVAYRSYPGEVTARPYEEGLAFNRTLAARAEERALGWRAKLEAVSIGSGQIRLRADIRDAAGAPVRGLRLAGVLERPATEAGRLQRGFTETRPGVYDATAPEVPGAWDLSLSGRDAQGRPFEAQGRLIWR
jgi:nitrogen fixation protein FixH